MRNAECGMRNRGLRQTEYILRSIFQIAHFTFDPAVRIPQFAFDSAIRNPHSALP